MFMQYDSLKKCHTYRPLPWHASMLLRFLAEFWKLLQYLQCGVLMVLECRSNEFDACMHVQCMRSADASAQNQPSMCSAPDIMTKKALSMTYTRCLPHHEGLQEGCIHINTTIFHIPYVLYRFVKFLRNATPVLCSFLDVRRRRCLRRRQIFSRFDLRRLLKKGT